MLACGNRFAASPFLPSPLLFYHTGPSVGWIGTCHRDSELTPSVRNCMPAPHHLWSFNSSATSLGMPYLTAPPPDSTNLDLIIQISVFSLICHWHFTSLSEITLFIFTRLFSLLVFFPSSPSFPTPFPQYQQHEDRNFVSIHGWLFRLLYTAWHLWDNRESICWTLLKDKVSHLAGPEQIFLILLPLLIFLLLHVLPGGVDHTQCISHYSFPL